VKCLFWDRGGFVLYYKRLERCRFKLPKVEAGATRIDLDAVQLSMLLDGIDFGRVRRPELWQPPTETPDAER
jgi:transposase